MRTFVYVDGFNLYYRALRGTPYKWLDLHSLVVQLLDAQNEILAIRYFTARVSGRSDPDQPRRQQVYLNALKTLRGLTIHHGRFLTKTKWRPLVEPGGAAGERVQVHDTEEKGSDVNLAAHLINDGWHNRYDVAVVLSQDSDLVEPLRIVRADIGKPVGLVWSDGRTPSGPLCKSATFVRSITPSRLKAAQFPEILNSRGKLIQKPDGW